VLDLAGLAGGYQVPAGQTIAGSGTVAGSLVFGRGSTISPGLPAASPSVATTVAVPEPGGIAVVAAGVIAGLICRRLIAAA